MQDVGAFLGNLGQGVGGAVSGVEDAVGGAANGLASGVSDVVGKAPSALDGLLSGSGATPTAGLTGSAGDSILPGGSGADSLIPAAAPANFTPTSDIPSVPTDFLTAQNPAGALALRPGAASAPGLPTHLEQPGGWFHDMFGGSKGADWAKLAIPAALVGGSIYEGTKGAPGLGNIKSLAQSEGGLAKQFGDQTLGELTTGTLPAPAQAALDQALRDAHSSIKSKYASMGMTGSTAEAQDLDNADKSAVAQRFKIAQELAQTGLSALSSTTGTEAELYQAILQSQTQQDAGLAQALAGFAGALVH